MNHPHREEQGQPGRIPFTARSMMVGCFFPGADGRLPIRPLCGRVCDQFPSFRGSPAAPRSVGALGAFPLPELRPPWRLEKAPGPPPRPDPRGFSTLHRAPVGQGPSGPGWLAIAFGFWSRRALATGTAWAGLCLIHHHHDPRGFSCRSVEHRHHHRRRAL